jgi:tetratricopeptide (TPR) repeat protein
MILAIAAAASLAAHSPKAAAAPAPVPVAPVAAAPDPAMLKDASHAIDAGRLKEARLIIARAATAGFRGAPIERVTADLAFASGNYLQAWSQYRHLAGSPDKQQSDCEKGAVAALNLLRAADAKPLVDCAVQSPSASWRAWNARGVLADMQQDWATADESYAHARQLAPSEANIVNNQGWSKLLRGDWAGALPLFENAAALDSTSQRIANNLELVRAALAADLPARRGGETNAQWAARLNDAGVAAELVGNKQRAVAAFTQALDASPVWYDRASNNLAALGGH